MRFLIDQQLFSEERNDALLWPLLLGILHREHCALLSPSWRSRGQGVHAFLERTTSSALRILCRRAFERGLEEFRSAPPGQKMQWVSLRDWPGNSPSPGPRIHLLKAIRLSWTPLWILLENGRNDLAFLRGILPKHHRDWLDRQISRGQIEIPPSGGTGEIGWLLEDLATTPEREDAGLSTSQIRRERIWVMFDRDTEPSDLTKPSPISQKLLNLANSKGIPACQLGRRTMENYLPEDVLFWWAEGGKDRRKKEHNRKVVAAFQRMTREQKRIYNWKEGLNKDFKNPSPPIPPFDTLTPGDLLLLASGFGKKIGESWEQDTSGSEKLKQADIDKVFRHDPEDEAWRQQLILSLRRAR